MPELYKRTIFFVLTAGFLIYSVHLYCNLPVTGKEISAVAIEGKKLWQENNCGSCHQVFGLGGYLGPDLTNVYSQRGPEYIRAFVEGGNRVMPAFRLPDEQMKQLLNYLKSVDASGISDPRSFEITYAGYIEQK